MKEILTITGQSDRPAVLVGDLNAVPETPEMTTVLNRFSDVFAELDQDGAFTYPVDNPNRRIDYILTKGDIEPLSAKVIDTEASDHLPIVADLRITQTPNGLNPKGIPASQIGCTRHGK